MKHKWGDKVRFPHKTEQQCGRCNLVKVTHHQHEGGLDRYWTDFWQGDEQIHSDGRTPACERVGVAA